MKAFKLSFTVLLALSTWASLSTTSALAKGKGPDIMKACKKECPDAKTADEAHECVEKLEQGDGGQIQEEQVLHPPRKMGEGERQGRSRRSEALRPYLTRRRISRRKACGAGSRYRGSPAGGSGWRSEWPDFVM